MMTPADVNKMEQDEEEVTIEVVNPDAVSVETEDGGMVIDFTGEQVEEIIGRYFPSMELTISLPSGGRGMSEKDYMDGRKGLI